MSAAREEIRAAHDRGLDPIRVCAKLTAVVDRTLEALWNAALADMSETDAAKLRDGGALVAHGGYGRRQLAPRSDVDLMILHAPSATDQAGVLAARLTQDIFDVGLDLGHSVRTPDAAMRIARTDAVVATSLLESRHLVGSQPLFEGFFQGYRDALQRRGSGASTLFVAARREERAKNGQTVYLLEPNVKRSRGGLRDVHLLRWLWFTQVGVSDLDRLRAMDVISKFDHHRLCSARDFLLRVRNELHFAATAAGDTLNRAEQVRIAERFGYRGAEGVRPVESFMRDYFRHASHVSFMANRLAELTAPRPAVSRVLDPVMGRSISRDYRVGLRDVTATSAGLDKLRRRVDEALRIADLARTFDRRISQEAWYAIYRAAPGYGTDLSTNAAERFVNILANPQQLSQLLRRLHELGVLEKVIPEFGHARCLLQFNQLHKFTVDEHCLRAVEKATRFADRDDLLGKTYDELEDKSALHLALLLHDLGKGTPGDHSVVGEEIAGRTAERLRLDEGVGRTLRVLVRRHLEMSHLAFRRNSHDPDELGRFVEWIESPGQLTLLYLLTCADIAAVGEGTLNDWKVGVLSDLYTRTLDRLEGVDHVPKARATRDAVEKRFTAEEGREGKLAARLEELPDRFVDTRSAASVAGALRRMHRLAGESPDQGADAWGGYINDATAVEMVAAVAAGAGRGVFSRMAGALSSKGLGILSAETTLLSDGLLLLRFTATDPQTSATTNAAEANRRVSSIATAMTAALATDEPPQFPRIWGADRAAADAALAPPETKVRTDTETSAECLLVEVQTVDRVGLLYELSLALHEMGLVIRSARIATSGNQVVDVFYVTERGGAKPTTEDRRREITDRLTAVIDATA